MDGTKFNNFAMASDVGNSASIASSVTLAAEASGGVHNMLELPADTEVEELVLFHDAMGSGTTLQVGISYPDGDGTDDDDLFLVSAASTSAGRRESIVHPFTTTGRAIITVTNAGGSAATGKATVLPRYTYRGNL